MTKYTIVIETPRNSREKYTYDEESKSFFLKKLLPAGMCFPYDFGFIPNTKGEDEDPIDALIISEFGTFPGCKIECRLIGALLAEQTEKNKVIRNDRFFFVPCISWSTSILSRSVTFQIFYEGAPVFLYQLQ
jgi:inorganic pyrophosphatase